MRRTLINPQQQLRLGQRIHSILYGGRDGIVYNIHGSQSPNTVGTLGGVVCVGGSASFDIVFDNGTQSLGLPEAILRGVQWQIYDELARPEEIAFLLEKVAVETTRRKTEDDQRKREFADKVAALRTDAKYAHLKQGNDVCSGKLAAANIRIELKRVFPKITFSVRKRSHGSVDVSWIDGPRPKQFEDLVNKYRSGSFNGMEDIYEMHSTPFNAVFGGTKYLSCQRSISVVRMKEAALHIAHECELPLLEIKGAGGYGYVSRTDDSEQLIRYSIHLDFTSGEPTLCRNEQREYYSRVVTQWAFALSYEPVA